jgi:acetylornithine deacetylase/succinyl-diaminopimelate desuccinylase-like protein
MPRSATAVATMAETHALLAPARARLRARDPDIVRLQVELAEIPAPTGEEGERGERVARHLRAAGLSDVRVDDAGNVLGLRPGRGAEGAPVVVCANLDTVFPGYRRLVVRREGGRLVGPGMG